MSANDGAVDHQILVVAVGGEGVKYLFPYTSVTPATEAPVHRLPAAITLRQITPVRARPQNPQTSVHKQSVI
jgi:hypothetical protein